MKKIIAIFFAISCISTSVWAQEFNAKVSINSQQIATTIDKSIFNTLQTQLTNFINSRKWSTDVFQPQEKIQCNFMITLNSVDDNNVYSATLLVQAGRPVYNSAYQSALLNFQDADVQFKYVQFQPVEFNENRVQGTDALTANLTAVLAYYSLMILGLDYDSFSAKGGEAFFKRAQNIVNNAPEASGISGWKNFDGLRNRYWLADNLMNSRYNQVHDMIYNYYRSGLDQMYQNDADGREQVLDMLSNLQDFNQENPNTMIAQVLVQGKSKEFIGIFKKGDPSTRSQAANILAAVDVSNASTYKAELK